MFLFVIGILVFVATVIFSAYSIATKNEASRKVLFPVILAGIILSILLCLLSFVVTISPGNYGIAYHLNGEISNLNVGYNFTEPWSQKHQWTTTMQVLTFSQGSANDDIYGAQTKEKDYIQVVATLGIHIDIDKINEYISLYGDEQINSERITKLLKTLSRNSIENIIGTYGTAEVMGNKKKIGEEAEAHLRQSIEKLPFVLDYFTIDDLVAPESYEQAITAQAKLRMDKETAALQQQLNAEEAAANKTKAEGEAEVLRTQAQAQADVKKIEAENAASIAKIQAENNAEVKRIQAEADANVRKIDAEAKANETKTQANAEAEAVIMQGEAEAKSILAQGEAYKQNPQLIELKVTQINAEVQSKWAEKWSGFSFDGMAGFNFTNFTDIIKEIVSAGRIPATE